MSCTQHPQRHASGSRGGYAMSPCAGPEVLPVWVPEIAAPPMETQAPCVSFYHPFVVGLFV